MVCMYVTLCTPNILNHVICSLLQLAIVWIINIYRVGVPSKTLRLWRENNYILFHYPVVGTRISKLESVLEYIFTCDSSKFKLGW